MRRGLAAVLVIGVGVGMGAAPALADKVYHSRHYRLRPVNGAPLRSGFVENIHANGPTVYAHELYVLNGARPNTTYRVVLRIYPGDTTCSTTPILLQTALLRTNVAGNGHASHVFTPADANGLHGLTVGARWTLYKGTAARYRTGCETVVLD